MSLPTEPADNPKPVVKDKNPHNYRKVGYSMIIISVSLVIIGLLSWALADDYHFSTNIMALQEVDAMTPKSGYNIMMFDISQPVGAKLKLLDHADTIDEALSMQTQDAQQNQGKTIQVLLFNGTKDYNLKLMQDAEVYIQTPKSGYNVILDNYPLAVGAQLTLASHEESYDNATAYQKVQEDQIQGQEVKVLIFNTNYKDNLQMITNSSTAVGAYAILENQTVATNTNQTAANQTAANQTAANQTTSTVSTNTTNATSVKVLAIIPANQTVSTPNNQSATTSSKTTKPTMTNMTTTDNQTATTGSNKMMVSSTQTPATANMTTNNQTNQTTKANAPTTNNVTVMIANGASATKGSCTTTDCFNPQFITIPVGSAVTWTNDDSVGHTATSGKLTDNQTGTVFDSSLISAGKSYTSPPFNTAGTYYYFCQVHPWMTGQISVSATANSATQTAAKTKTVTLNETMGVNATGK